MAKVKKPTPPSLLIWCIYVHFWARASIFPVYVVHTRLHTCINIVGSRSRIDHARSSFPACKFLPIFWWWKNISHIYVYSWCSDLQESHDAAIWFLEGNFREYIRWRSFGMKGHVLYSNNTRVLPTFLWISRCIYMYMSDGRGIFVIYDADVNNLPCARGVIGSINRE